MIYEIEWVFKNKRGVKDDKWGIEINYYLLCGFMES